MARPPRWKVALDASVAEACLAVRLYNDPSEVRSFEGFVIHMHMAWLYLLHAEFIRDRIDIRYWDPNRPHRLLRVDGEPKCWELGRCVIERWPNGGAVPANLDFFIKLRNKFEHRHSRADVALALAVAGHAHAHLINFEEELTSQFGQGESLATKLRFPVFVGTFSDAGEQALRRLRSSLPKHLRTFIADYHSGLDTGIASDQHFELRLRVTLELAQRDPTATAIQFTRLDDLTDGQRAMIEQMGRVGHVIVREQQRGVYGLNLLKPSDVVKQVDAAIPFSFNMVHFIAAWKTSGIRPHGTDDHPARTDERYCVYDSLNGNYGYTAAYVKHLIKRCTTADGFREVTGYYPA